MVFNSPIIVGVANVSADLCQYIACNPERLSSDEVLYLLFCFPCQQLRRFALCFWTFFCFPVPNPYLSFPSFSSSSSSSSWSSDSDLDLEDSHPHASWCLICSQSSILVSVFVYFLPCPEKKGCNFYGLIVNFLVVLGWLYGKKAFRLIFVSLFG